MGESYRRGWGEISGGNGGPVSAVGPVECAVSSRSVRPHLYYSGVSIPPFVRTTDMWASACTFNWEY